MSAIGARVVAARFRQRYPKAELLWPQLTPDERRMYAMVQIGAAAPVLVRDWEDLYRVRSGSAARQLPAAERQRRQRAEINAAQELMFA